MKNEYEKESRRPEKNRPPALHFAACADIMIGNSFSDRKREITVKQRKTFRMNCILLAALLVLSSALPAAAQTEPAEKIVPIATFQKELISMEINKVEAMERETVDELPLYFQTDYPNDKYADGTIADSGCSVTALAMVASYLTGHKYLPDELAYYFGGRAENNIARLEYGSEKMQLPFEARLNFHQTIQGLKDGKIAIVLMRSDSIFTDNQHFIVLAGYNEAGKIIVYDPYEPNYSQQILKNAFANGFEEGDIQLGFSGGWLYDKSAMPEEPFLYKEEIVKKTSRYGDIELTFEEKTLLAQMIWVEARGESKDGQQAVAEVVLNRMVSENFPNTIEKVILQKDAFRSAPLLDTAEPYDTQFEAIERAVYGPYVLPVEVYYFDTTPVNDNVWGKIGGHVFCYE